MCGSTCSDSSVLRRGEEVALRDSDGGQSQYAHHYQVDEARLRRAVEGVVQPGHERSHDEEGDPAVVQPGTTDSGLNTQRTICSEVSRLVLRSYFRSSGGVWVPYLEKTLETPSE